QVSVTLAVNGLEGIPGLARHGGVGSSDNCLNVLTSRKEACRISQISEGQLNPFALQVLVAGRGAGDSANRCAPFCKFAHDRGSQLACSPNDENHFGSLG